MKSRLAYPKILAEANKTKISVILGARQVGKTTILRQLQQKLGGLLLDLDVFSNYEKISSYEQFLTTLKSEGYSECQKETFYVFLDEFQRYEDLTKIFKNIYDHHQNIKLFVTGSSSLTIKNQIQESLSGRQITTILYPLSFEEFLIFKEEEDLLKTLNNIRKLKSATNYLQSNPKLAQRLEEFLIWGGYPEVVLQDNDDNKKEIFGSIFDAYIKKDLVDYLKIEKIKAAKTLIERLAINHGGIANYNDFASAAQINAVTAKNYIELLQETFIIQELRPFFTNKNKEVVKAPKLYFIDNGARNYFINNFNAPDLSRDSGDIFEAFVISELLKQGYKADQLKYYRTKNQVEVDLIIDTVSEQIPVEIKYSKQIKQDHFAGLRNFYEQYKPKQSILINLADIGSVNFGEHDIEIKSCFTL